MTCCRSAVHPARERRVRTRKPLALCGVSSEPRLTSVALMSHLALCSLMMHETIEGALGRDCGQEACRESRQMPATSTAACLSSCLAAAMRRCRARSTAFRNLFVQHAPHAEAGCGDSIGLRSTSTNTMVRMLQDCTLHYTANERRAKDKDRRKPHL